MALVDIVQYSATPDVFAWKYPNSELSTRTQLIVQESQEAVLFRDGQALDVFSSGRYTLETGNIPYLSKLINLPYGGKSPFKAEVWFVNRAHLLDVKWGTPTPIQLQDPKFGIMVPVRSFGQFGLRITDSKSFLVKLVGSMPAFDRENMLQYFRGLYLTKVRNAISSYVVHRRISLLEINAYIDELSSHMGATIAAELAEYGIELVNFYVNDISFPSDDPGVKSLQASLAKRAEMDIVGYSYDKERSYDALEGAAKNPRPVIQQPMVSGLGYTGSPVTKAAEEQLGGMAEKLLKKEESQKVTCTSCGHQMDKGVKFCPECGDKYRPCPGCGRDLNEHELGCPNCGYKTSAACPGCGHAIDGTAKFCPECGSSLAQTQKSKTCGNCGAAIEGTPNFCPECGKKL